MMIVCQFHRHYSILCRKKLDRHPWHTHSFWFRKATARLSAKAGKWPILDDSGIFADKWDQPLCSPLLGSIIDRRQFKSMCNLKVKFRSNGLWWRKAGDHMSSAFLYVPDVAQIWSANQYLMRAKNVFFEADEWKICKGDRRQKTTKTTAKMTASDPNPVFFVKMSAIWRLGSGKRERNIRRVKAANTTEVTVKRTIYRMALRSRILNLPTALFKYYVYVPLLKRFFVLLSDLI